MRPTRLLILMLVAGAVACDENPVGPTPIRDVTWKLEAIERAGSATVVIPDPEQYTLRLESDGRISVRADCNTCNGRYSLSGTSLSLITPIACTRAFCSLSSLDGSYVGTLENTQSIFISNGRLILQGNGVTLRFRN